MLHIRYFDSQGGVTLPSSSIKEYLSKEEGILWVDIREPEEEELVLLETEFKFHELAIEDCIFPQNQPKLDDYKDYLFLVCHFATIKNTEKEMEIIPQEINFFLGKNFLVSVYDEPIPAWESVQEQIKKGLSLIRPTPDSLLHFMLDTLVDAYFPIIEDLEDKIDSLSEEMLSYPSKATLEQVFMLKRNVATLRKILSPQRSIFAALSRIGHQQDHLNLIKEDISYYFKDIYDHLIKLVDLLSSYQERMTSILEIYFSSVSHRINEAIRVLTGIATIFLPFLMVTSYYGMNIKFPELIFGKYNILLPWGIAIFLTLILFFYLKRRGR